MFETVPDVLSVADICSVLKIGRTKAYHLIKTGQIPSVKVGNAIRIPKQLLLDYLSPACYSGNGTDKLRYNEGGAHENNG